MKLKLKFMLPDIKTANNAFDKLLLARVKDSQIHFLSNPDMNLGKLPVASAIETTNIIHEGERGILIGAGLGLLAGLYVLKFPPWVTKSPLWYTDSHWSIVLAVTILGGVVFVMLGSAMLGVNLFNTDLKHYKNKIDNGGILMIVSVPFYEAGKIRNIMKPYR
ncbi:MAG: hypothetical protein WC009_11980 [Methylotenera sp.]